MGSKDLKPEPQLHCTLSSSQRRSLSLPPCICKCSVSSPSVTLSSYNGRPPAALRVNDHIHYSSRISVIIDFVRTVCIPQCVLNPIPKRCWTLSHLIRSHESATLRQLLQLLHYMLDNWWPMPGFTVSIHSVVQSRRGREATQWRHPVFWCNHGSPGEWKGKMWLFSKECRLHGCPVALWWWPPRSPFPAARRTCGACDICICQWTC